MNALHYWIRMAMAQLGLRMANAALRKRPRRLDRLCIWLLEKALAPKHPSQDYMRDELVDSGIEFDAQELTRYQQGKTPSRE